MHTIINYDKFGIVTSQVSNEQGKTCSNYIWQVPNLCIGLHQTNGSGRLCCPTSTQQENHFQFFIFLEVKNFIERCEIGTTMAMQPKVWMITIPFDKWVSHFITCVQAHGSNLCLVKCHLLLIDGHNSHVTAIDIVHMARGLGLDLINFPSHTSHVLQPFDVA